MRTPAQHLADLILNEPVEDWIARRRQPNEKGKQTAWRRIAQELHYLSDGKVDVTTTTLMAWDTAARERVAS